MQTNWIDQRGAVYETLHQVLSHDIKAPLRGISSVSQWLIEDYKSTLDGTAQSYLCEIQTQTTRAVTMLNMLLEYVEIKRNDEALEAVLLDLDVLSSSVLSQFDNGCQIQIAVVNPLPLLWGEPLQLEQLFTYLIINAVEYMNSSDGQITITYEDKNDFWEISIADNGVGIHQRNKDDIFKLFYTTSDAKKSAGGGVGLAFAKRIVELHEGKIWFESTLGIGTTFFILLPKREQIK